MTESAARTPAPNADVLVLAGPEGGSIRDLGFSFVGDSAIIKRAADVESSVLAMERARMPYALASQSIERPSVVTGVPDPIAAVLSAKALRTSFPPIDGLLTTFRDDAPSSQMMADFVDVGSLTGFDVITMEMPWARDHTVADHTLLEGPATMGTGTVDGVQLPVDVEHNDLAVA